MSACAWLYVRACVHAHVSLSFGCLSVCLALSFVCLSVLPICLSDCLCQFMCLLVPLPRLLPVCRSVRLSVWQLYLPRCQLVSLFACACAHWLSAPKCSKLELQRSTVSIIPTSLNCQGHPSPPEHVFTFHSARNAHRICPSWC